MLDRGDRRTARGHSSLYDQLEDPSLFFAPEGVRQDDIHPEPVPKLRIVKYHPLAFAWPAIARVQRHAQTFG
jgi:hypothetical protein